MAYLAHAGRHVPAPSQKALAFAILVALLVLGVFIDPSDAFVGVKQHGAVSRLYRQTPSPIASIGGRDAQVSRMMPIVALNAPSANDEGGSDDAAQNVDSRPRLALLRRIVTSAAKPGGRLRRKLRPAVLAVLTSLTLNLQGGAPPPPGGLGPSLLRPPAAHARLPIDAVQDTNLDVKEIGMRRAVKERDAKRAAEALDHRAKCDRIESERGTKARRQYEAEYEARAERRRANKAASREELLNELLDKGIDPFTDTEGIRQVFLHDEDIDLAKVEGTEQYYDFVETMAGKGKRVSKKYEVPRFIVKCQVDDLRAHKKDPVAYFYENQPKTSKLFDMPDRQVKAIADQYRARIAEFGSINPVEKGGDDGGPAETANDAAKHGAEAGDKAGSKRAAREAAREERRAAKAAARSEAERARAEAKARKEEARAAARADRVRAREEKAAAMEDRKAARAAAKAGAAAAAAAAAHAAADAETAATAGMEMMATAGQEAVMPSHMDGAAAGGEGGEGAAASAAAGESEDAAAAAGAAAGGKAKAVTAAKKKLPIVPATAVVGVAGGGYAFKVSRDRAAAEEEERQRQFKLIMGMNDDDDEDDDDDDDDEETFGGASSITGLTDAPKPAPSSEKKAEISPAPAPAKAKKRFGGIKSVFSKKPGRETDLSALVAPDAKAPEFSSVLAKALTFGAPGRFPQVQALPGGMPMDEFDLDKARELLQEEKEKAGLTDQDAAEAFACVVNCMIIDIIDLASSTLKEKEDKPTAEAMNVVMDFMDHAAGLFEPFLTEGVTIKPVTYGGTLGKGKLEQLYSTYATAIMSEAGITEERIEMFRELFEIKEKKAEGLVQKKMMANLFKMMKDPDAMKDAMGGEGMEEMMAALGGGMDGLGGMPGMDEELSPEQLKESVNMMRELVESGSVSKEEMNLVKEQFKAAYGMDMAELIENADSEEVREQLGDDGEELLEMFKIILKATE